MRTRNLNSNSGFICLKNISYANLGNNIENVIEIEAVEILRFEYSSIFRSLIQNLKKHRQNAGKIQDIPALTNTKPKTF